MTPTEFCARLEAAARKTGLTTSDLAVWLDRPRPTVRTWLVGQNKPSVHLRGEIWDELAQKLIWLERSDAFPIPFNRPRAVYLREAMDRERLRSVRRGVPAEPEPTSPDIGF